MKNIILLSILSLPISILGQSSIKKAVKEYDNFNYTKVIKKIGGKKDITTDAKRKLADSYKMVGNYTNAELVYSDIVNATDKKNEDVYSYAQILRMNGKYADAQKQMDIYNTLNPSDSRVKLYSKNKTYTIDLLKNKGQFTVKSLSINSPEQDFGVVYYKDQIVYASTKQSINSSYRLWNGNNLPFLDLYIGKADTNSEILNSKKMSSFNKKFHEGPVSYSKDGSVLVYTSNNYHSKSTKGIINLEMYEAKFKDGKWSKKIAFPFNNKEYSVGHPSLSADGNTLYFISDMPGGKGGTDIYKTVRNTNGTWDTPVNLGDKVNTEGNEMFPFIHESGLFFFSSDGIPGLGGLDVFVTQIKNNIIDKVTNLGAPINGSKDDFSFVLNSEKSKGYFASNRDGGKGDDDIYSFNLLKSFQFGKTIKGIAKDKDGNILANTTVNLYDSEGKLIQTVTTSADGAFTFDVENSGSYKLKGQKDSYFDGNSLVNVSETADVVSADVVLEKNPGLSLLAIITDATTKNTLDGVKVTITDAFTGKPFDTFVTSNTGTYRKALPNNKIGDRIGYTIKLEKSGYLTKEVVFNYEIKKAGEINVHEALNVSLSKLEIGGDLAKMIDIKPIYFDLGKYNIRKDAGIELDKIIKIMNEYPNMVIELGSHTDCRASAVFNEKLSDNRAKASAAYIKKSITNPERISGKGYGESKLKNGCACEGDVKSTCTEEEHQQNRRTEFIILKFE